MSLKFCHLQIRAKGNLAFLSAKKQRKKFLLEILFLSGEDGGIKKNWHIIYFRDYYSSITILLTTLSAKVQMVKGLVWQS